MHKLCTQLLCRSGKSGNSPYLEAIKKRQGMLQNNVVEFLSDLFQLQIQHGFRYSHRIMSQRFYHSTIY